MGKTNPRNANGNARRKLRARLRAEGRPCHICGMPIDYGLPAGDEGAKGLPIVRSRLF